MDTPRCNALESNPLDSFDLLAWKTLARELERDLQKCAAAHMRKVPQTPQHREGSKT